MGLKKDNLHCLSPFQLSLLRGEAEYHNTPRQACLDWLLYYVICERRMITWSYYSNVIMPYHGTLSYRFCEYDPV